MNHIRDFLHTYPDIHLDFLFSHHLIDHLIQDQVDMIIDCKPHLHQNLEKIHLFREQYITIASPEFIKKKHIASLDDLERVKILSMDKDLDWWHNFITAIPADKRGCLKNVMDEFYIYIKKERMAFQRHQLLVDYLTKLKPSEFGAG